jgi:hypothetical protein
MKVVCKAMSLIRKSQADRSVGTVSKNFIVEILCCEEMDFFMEGWRLPLELISPLLKNVKHCSSGSESSRCASCLDSSSLESPPPVMQEVGGSNPGRDMFVSRYGTVFY